MADFTAEDIDLRQEMTEDGRIELCRVVKRKGLPKEPFFAEVFIFY